MKRGLLTILLFLLLGVIVNIAVAWGCALWIDINRGVHEVITQSNGVGYDVWTIGRHEARGATRIYSSHVPRGAMGRSLPAVGAAGDPSSLVPGWAEGVIPPAEPADAFKVEQIVDARGWLWPALRSTRRWEQAERRGAWRRLPTRSGIALDEDESAGPSASFEVRVLPLRPVWPGFYAGAFGYGFLLWLLWFMLLHERLRLLGMRRRLGRGQCPACGYDLSKALTAGCPECGWGREKVKSKA